MSYIYMYIKEISYISIFIPIYISIFIRKCKLSNSNNVITLSRGNKPTAKATRIKATIKYIVRIKSSFDNSME